MKAKGGYMGQLLFVDLSNRKTWSNDSHMEHVNDFIGGSGLGTKLLYESVSQEVDPLDPENLLIFLTGPLTGTAAITSARHAVVARSPLTGLIGESDSGGSWGFYLKASGYDGIVFTGASETPVYLLATDDKVEIIEASELWGIDTFDTDQILKSKHGKVAVACIGQGGENLVSFASIMNEGRDARAAGRTGLGAVMGSKNLKAVVVGGKRITPVNNNESLKTSVKRITPQVVKKTKRRKIYGTADGIVPAAALADLPVKNWRIGSWIKEAEKISGNILTEKYLTGRYHCKGCPIGCGRKVASLHERVLTVAGPEYESIAGFGSMVLITDLQSINYATELCNRYGLDVISTASTIAFAMEATENNVFFDDIKPEWGKPADVIGLINKIAFRDGVGNLLAKGTREAAKLIGGNAFKWAVQSKGLELAFHDPRALSSLAIAYATSPRGGCHRGMTHSIERSAMPELGFEEPFGAHHMAGKAEASAKMQDYAAIFNSLKLCHFLMDGTEVTDIVSWYNSVTGHEDSLEQFLQKGERIFNLQRLINLKYGATGADDSLPDRIFEPFINGAAEGYVPPLKDMLIEYYNVRGWDKQGIPENWKLRMLNL